jgi:hypothetical protein
MKFLRYLKENWGSYITILFPILVGIDAIKDILDGHYLRWILGIALFLIANWHTAKTFKSKKELEDRVSNLENINTMLVSNLESVPVDMIKILSKHFKLENNDRVTLYRVRDKDTFIPVARFSESPIYREFGRSEYPIDSGFIGQCWVQGEVTKEKLADYDSNPQRYIKQALKQGGMTEDEVKSLQMKSRSFYCKRLHYNGDDPIAIIVIESMNTSLPANLDEIKEFLGGPFGKVLIDTVQKNTPIGQEGTNNGQN